MTGLLYDYSVNPENHWTRLAQLIGINFRGVARTVEMCRLIVDGLTPQASGTVQLNGFDNNLAANLVTQVHSDGTVNDVNTQGMTYSGKLLGVDGKMYRLFSSFNGQMTNCDNNLVHAKSDVNIDLLGQ